MDDLIKQAQDNLFIRIYGTEAWEFPKTENNEITSLGLSGDNLKLIRVVAIGFGITTDHCIKVNPYYLMVGGIGKPAECNGNKFPETVKVWILNKNAVTTRMDTYSGTVEELIENELFDDDEEQLGPVDLKVKPSLRVTVRERGQNNICIEYSASVVAYYRVLGSKWQKLASASIGGSECLTDNACVNVFNEKYITGKICYYPNSNKVCLEVKVGYKGASIKGTECFNL